MPRFVTNVRGHVFWVISACFSLALFASPAPAVAGVGDNVSGWAWSGTAGWVATNCLALGTCTPDFGVKLTSVPGSKANLTGYAWSETFGWICFGTTCGGTSPEGAAPYAQYRAEWNGKQDQVYGWAQVVSLGADGWLSLNCDHDNDAHDECAISNYFIALDTSTGNFTKGVFNDHWAWGGNSVGTGLGWVDMSAVSTSWVPAGIGRVVRPEGIYEPLAAGLPGTHLFAFEIMLADTWASAGQRAECDLALPDGSTRTAGTDVTATLRGGVLAVDYSMGPSDTVQQNKIWYITTCRLADAPGATPCASDAGCQPAGVCDESAGFCRQILYSTERKLPVFTHGNEWSGLEASEDQYAAVKCHAGFPGSYFKNAAQCDFAGDASFALTMRRGMPLEGYCADGIDNDGNGQIDCEDRYCQGISYRCQTLPRTTCLWGQEDDGVGDCTASGYAFGELCCGRQPLFEGAAQTNIVDGLECRVGDQNDGYFDCSCTGAAQFDASGTDDCFSPGAQAGDLCCDADDTVKKL